MKFSKYLEIFSIITSLIIAGISLIVSVIALRVSEQTLVFSSKDYIPQITYLFKENGDIIVENKSTDLFKIKCVNILQVKTLGFEDIIREGMVEVPVITHSLYYRSLVEDKLPDYFIIKSDQAGPCAYICPYDENIVKKMYDKLESDYSIDSEKGYALPSLQNLTYYIEIEYSNNFEERKSIIFERTHVHGFGFDSQKISEEEFVNILKNLDIPKFNDFEKFWSYVTKKNFTPYN